MTNFIIDFSEIPVTLRGGVREHVLEKLRDNGFQYQRCSSDGFDILFNTKGKVYNYCHASSDIHLEKFDAVYDFDKIVELIEGPKEIIVRMRNLSMFDTNLSCTKDCVLLMGEEYSWDFVDKLVEAKHELRGNYENI